MNYNYTLKYKTFDSLLEDVKLDMKNFSLEGKIDPATLYRVATQVNYDLGLRINMTKEVLLEICGNKVKLPDDFYVMNFANLCGEHTVTYAMPQGTNIQEVPFPYPNYREFPQYPELCEAPTVNCAACGVKPCGCKTTACLTTNECGPIPPVEYNPAEPYGNYCVKPRVYMDCKGNTMQLIQILNTETRTYKHMFPIKFKNSQFIDCDCPNLHYATAMNEAYIKDGFIYLNVEEGNIYLNYQGDLTNEDNELMVVDHPMISVYYEYALKKRILENLMMDGENVSMQMQIIVPMYREARNNALSIVNTPNFSEMYKMWATNRKAQYSKYYNMFKSYGWYYDYGINNAV